MLRSKKDSYPPIYTVELLSCARTGLESDSYSPPPSACFRLPRYPGHLRPLFRPFSNRPCTTKALNSREVMTHAKIDGERYSFYAAMLVHSNVNDTRAVLTNYALYSKLISYVKKAEYNPANHILKISEASWVGPCTRGFVRRARGSVDSLHLRCGAFHRNERRHVFRTRDGEKRRQSSLVYMGGALSQTKWPPIPKLILEWGAEIVFGFTGHHMRSYIESPDSKNPSNSPSKPNDQQNLPQPRSHL